MALWHWWFICTMVMPSTGISRSRPRFLIIWHLLNYVLYQGVNYSISLQAFAAILADHVMPNLQCVDVMVWALHDWYLAKHFIPAYTNTWNQLANLNTKLHGVNPTIFLPDKS
jgi:hypothetical protein